MVMMLVLINRNACIKIMKYGNMSLYTLILLACFLLDQKWVWIIHGYVGQN